MGAINITIAILSNYQSDTILFLIFVFLVLLIMVFAATLSPVCWVIYYFYSLGNCAIIK